MFIPIPFCFDCIRILRFPLALMIISHLPGFRCMLLKL